MKPCQFVCISSSRLHSMESLRVFLQFYTHLRTSVVVVLKSEASVRSRKFADLTQLIQEYMMRGAKNGLAGPLRNPVSAENPSDDESGERLYSYFSSSF